MKLKPCPFCGFDATIAIDPPNEVCCGACGNIRCRAEGPIAKTEDEAAKLWNRRHGWTHGECEDLQLLLFGRGASYDECREAICEVYAERDALTEAAARVEQDDE